MRNEEATASSCLNVATGLPLNPLIASILLKGRYKKLDVKNANQYSNEKSLISVTRGP